MNAALFILATSCIFMGGLLLHVAIRHNALIEYNRELESEYAKSENEADRLAIQNQGKHLRTEGLPF